MELIVRKKIITVFLDYKEAWEDEHGKRYDGKNRNFGRE